MGKFLIFCRIQLKFCSWLYKKRWHTSCKFQLSKTSNKKCIAKKPLTNLYEINSRNDDHDLTAIHVLLKLLFISYKFVKGFLAVTFFIIHFFDLILSGCVSTFLIYPGTKFELDPTRDKEFPHRPPIIKKPTFVTSCL